MLNGRGMHNSIKQNIRGLLLIIPLVAIAVVVAIIARPQSRYSEPRRHESKTSATTEATNKTEYRSFDPNTADYFEMVEAGVPRDIAVSLIRWREAGKVYRIKEDVALCYNMTDSIYHLLEPYIIIGKEYQFQPKAFDNEVKEVASATIDVTPFTLDTVGTNYLRGIGFTRRQAELVIKYRDMIGGYRTMEEFEECYAVDSAMAERLRPYIVFAKRDTTPHNEITFPIEINSADSTTLIRVKGIGPKSVVEIMRYRELLGGYHSVEQISELKVVTEENFRNISSQIWCDSAKIKKIYINFARPKELEVHPYVSNRMLRRIINHRELKGGWSTIEEMIESDILNDEEARRIAPYLDFGTKAQE